jgi:hypothetical protein
MELENIILGEVSQVQKAKNHMLFSYGDYRPNTNVAILRKNRICKGEVTHTRGGCKRRKLR